MATQLNGIHIANVEMIVIAFRPHAHNQANSCTENMPRRLSNVSAISQPNERSGGQQSPSRHNPKLDKRTGKPPAPFATTTSTTHLNSLFQADASHPNNADTYTLTHGALDPQGSLYIGWLCVVTTAFLYNAWVIPLRSSFPFQTPNNSRVWLVVDACADCIYLFDILFVRHRVMYLCEGFWVRDPKLTQANYMKKFKFKVSVHDQWNIAPFL